jgi:hypothetical protein
LFSLSPKLFRVFCWPTKAVFVFFRVWFINRQLIGNWHRWNAIHHPASNCLTQYARAEFWNRLHRDWRIDVSTQNGGFGGGISFRDLTKALWRLKIALGWHRFETNWGECLEWSWTDLSLTEAIDSLL